MGTCDTRRWVIVMPGTSRSVPLLRCWARQVTSNAAPERVADVELIVSEYATNATQHSASGEPGGIVRVEIMKSGDDRLRIEVHDAGLREVPRAGWRAGESEDFGRGFHIVDAVASAWGDEHTSEGHLAWAEVRHRSERRRGPRSQPASLSFTVNPPTDAGVLTVPEGPRGR